MTALLSAVVSIYRALKVWALTSMLFYESLNFRPRLSSQSRPESCRDRVLNFVAGFCCSKESYVATCFLCSSLDFNRDSVFLVATMMLSCFFKLVSRPSFSCHDIIYALILVAALSCIIVISVVTQKVCRNRVLPPLSLFPCCNFIFDVPTWTFVLGMFYMSRP